jgi:hypothetical protein
MFLAYDIGCKIYYQDTDSMHIECADVPKLKKPFKATFDRDLVGNDMGQFHNDFEEIDGEIPISQHGIFMGKKFYIDHVVNSKGHTAFQARGKGCTQPSIKEHGDLMQLYRNLFENHAVVFNLTEGQPMFKMNKDMTVRRLKEFKRKVQFLKPVGEREHYFEFAHTKQECPDEDFIEEQYWEDTCEPVPTEEFTLGLDLFEKSN